MPKNRKVNASRLFDPVSESLSPDQFESGNSPSWHCQSAEPNPRHLQKDDRNNLSTNRVSVSRRGTKLRRMQLSRISSKNLMGGWFETAAAKKRNMEMGVSDQSFCMAIKVAMRGSGRWVDIGHQPSPGPSTSSWLVLPSLIQQFRLNKLFWSHVDHCGCCCWRR
jgi:hypothetical protein